VSRRHRTEALPPDPCTSQVRPVLPVAQGFDAIRDTARAVKACVRDDWAGLDVILRKVQHPGRLLRPQ
jgi:hypothetical protein